MLEVDKNKFGYYQCICCSFFTIKEIKETCPVCYWEEDTYQQKYTDDASGPNLTSLKASRENYKKWGVVDIRFKEHVRSPLCYELPD